MEFRPLATESPYAWRIAPQGKMRVPAIIYADHALIEAMDHKVFEQLSNVASLPGIQQAAYAMPDAHWGYGFPIGGVAAFDPDEGGVVSGGGVGFDISCGVRTLHTGLTLDQLRPHKKALADLLAVAIPAGLGSTGTIKLTHREMDQMLIGGAAWAVQQGYGSEADLLRTEEHGCMAGANPADVSEKAKERQRREMGTLGSGNHYLEVQLVAQVYDAETAAAFDLREGEIVISIHCGSRGLGHQIGTEFLKFMATKAKDHGIWLPDRELACAPIESKLGQSYLGAMRAGINCALANRQILTHLTREVCDDVLPGTQLTLLYDVSHNTCKRETHRIDGKEKQLFVHRKGATLALGPGHPNLPDGLREVGQPVIIGGSMGTESYILAGVKESEKLAFSSACHGAGRAMSRHQATKRWHGRNVIKELETRGILIRSPSLRGVAEEAPGAYKDVSRVVDVAHQAGLSRKVARLEPLICVKG
ncbi:RtcB family protein [Candidatus Endoriftia persephonae]|jgi:tRNA-splicing ligase RtcB|uniref:tRNA-splicing ligase RtcB n=2 Tax=Gammaproteobacteria TaxID=1236 RepID=G2FG92_9GAMM|nr:RtcB family protein [Candidatus Endoriftia persephone]EGW54165.1 protein RtcB [endosymbiont of Tevnia jerichonana (vent Tica)]USF88619.1 RtcB family protein [Candidatus Endoriftia persephone]